jgi:hypothetical protein
VRGEEGSGKNVKGRGEEGGRKRKEGEWRRKVYEVVRH